MANISNELTDQTQETDSADNALNPRTEGGGNNASGADSRGENGGQTIEPPAVELPTAPTAVAPPVEPGANDAGLNGEPTPKREPGQSPAGSAAQVATNKIINLALDRIQPHPLNNILFGVTSPTEIKLLAESVAEVGLLERPKVIPDPEKPGWYYYVSGHKRGEAVASLGWEEVPVEVVEVADADDWLHRVVESNRQHPPNMEQQIRIGEVYFGFETKWAKARQIAGAKDKKSAEVVETVTPPAGAKKKEPYGTGTGWETGKARDLAAKRIGMSGVSFDRGRKVVKAIDRALKDGKLETAAKLRDLLNKKGINPAHACADDVHLIEKAEKSDAIGSKTKAQGGQGEAADQPQNAAPASAAPEKDAAVPGPAGTDGNAGHPAVGQEGKQIPLKDEVEHQPAAEVTNADELAPGASAVAIGVKFVEELKKIEFPDLSADLKHNLRRVLGDVKIWDADHEDMLKGPGQP